MVIMPSLRETRFHLHAISSHAPSLHCRRLRTDRLKAVISPPSSSKRPWMRQPVFHFAVLSAVLLVLSAATEPHTGLEPDREASLPKVPPDLVVERLQREFKAAKGRPMTPEEERRALETHRYDQALFEAALDTGMHETDPIVRRRLVQRMRFLLETMVEIGSPSDDELEALMEQRKDLFPDVEKLTFEHRFFARSKHGSDAAVVAERSKQALIRGEDVVGDHFPKRLRTEDVLVSDVARILGPHVARAFFEAPVGAWSDPIVSAYGTHLVQVENRTSRPPRLDHVRSRALALWQRLQRETRGREILATMRDGR